jgi:hypothetical protein
MASRRVQQRRAAACDSGVQQHERKARSAIGSWQRGDATGQPAVAWTEQLGVGHGWNFIGGRYGEEQGKGMGLGGVMGVVMGPGP